MIENSKIEKSYFEVVEDFKYLSELSAMQLIKFILSNKIDTIYDEYISCSDELDEYISCSNELNGFGNFSLDPRYQNYQDDFFESSEYYMLCECEEYVSYANLLFDTINKFNYSRN